MLRNQVGFQVAQYLAETLRLVHARSMDKQWMEEDSVALLHLQVHPGMLRVVATYPVIHLVSATLKTEQMGMCVPLCWGNHSFW